MLLITIVINTHTHKNCYKRHLSSKLKEIRKKYSHWRTSFLICCKHQNSMRFSFMSKVLQIVSSTVCTFSYKNKKRQERITILAWFSHVGTYGYSFVAVLRGSLHNGTNVSLPSMEQGRCSMRKVHAPIGRCRAEIICPWMLEIGGESDWYCKWMNEGFVRPIFAVKRLKHSSLKIWCRTLSLQKRSGKSIN